MTEPKIRFKKSDGSSYPDLSKKLIKDVMEERHELSILSDNLPQLSFTIEDGVIKPEDKKTNKRDFLIKDKATKKFAVTEFNDIIYNPANIKFGAIHRNKLGRGGVSPIYAIFKPKENPAYLEAYVQRKTFIASSMKYLEGTVEKLKSLKPNDFLKLEINLPCSEEQEEIVKFLNELDNTIKACEDEVHNLAKLKKGVMQSVFSQSVRFKDENNNNYEDWVEKKLGDCCNYSSSSLTISDAIDNGESPIYDAQNKIIGYYKKSKNDEFIGIIKDGSGVGRVHIIPSGSYCLGTMGMLTPKDGVNLRWLHKTLQHINWERYIIGGAIPHIYYKDYSSEKIKVPCLDEQIKIAELFDAFDVAINEANNDKKLKRGILQQMFI